MAERTTLTRLSLARTEQDARTAALSVRGALGQIEQELLAGPARVRQQRLGLSPARSVSGGRPYRERPRAELVALLLSTEATPWGLGGAGAVGIVGWTRRGRASLRYEVPVGALFESAGVAERASVATDFRGGASLGTSAAVPDIEGFVLTMGPANAPRGRLLAARGLLCLAVGACLLALGLVQRALAREARAVSREKAFVAGVTHELRTPVAAIRVFGEALAEGTGDAREYGALVAEESERLEALVERVLAATRMGEAPRFEAVRPAELVASAVRLMRPRAERRGVTLSVHDHGDVGDAHYAATTGGSSAASSEAPRRRRASASGSISSTRWRAPTGGAWT